MNKPKMFFRLRMILLSALVGMIAGCGYAFAPQGDHIDRSIVRIYVEPFGNKTAQAEAENFVRTAFIDEILQTSRFKTVATLEEADAVIGGNVVSISTIAISYRKSILAAEERMSVIIESSFREKATGKILWASRNIAESVDYELQDDINLLPAIRKKALAKLSRDAAEKAFSLMMSNF